MYDPKGNKIEEQRKVANMSTLSHQTRYCDNFIFEDGVLKRILVDGGFIYFGENDTTYHYFLKDHLGSNRAVVNMKTGEVAEQYDYYPFGKQHGDYHTGYIHPYRYNGKELDEIGGLDWLHYGARMMEPEWGRFTTPDPLAERYYDVSPYVYCGNNPASRIDPDGRDWYQQTNEYGATIYQYFEGSNDIEGWTNIGEKHTFTNGNISYSFEQNELVSMTESVLEEDDWCTQMASPTSKKSGEEGNCFYQAGEMVKRSGATSLGGTANNISGYKEMQTYMDDQIDAGYSVRVQVDRKSRSRDFDGRGDHWVAISSRTIDFRTNEVLYNYYDPGTYHKEKGTQPQNRFQLRGKTWTAPAPNNLKYNLINVRRNIR